jgi:hypothetical protein
LVSGEELHFDDLLEVFQTASLIHWRISVPSGKELDREANRMNI